MSVAAPIWEPPTLPDEGYEAASLFFSQGSSGVSDRWKFWRDRLHKTLGAPCWTGEAQPEGYAVVELSSNFPDLDFLLHLVSIGYPWCAAAAALPHAHRPWTNPVPDRRRRGVFYQSQDDEQIEEGATPTDSQPIVDVEHPYVPAAPCRRTKVGGGLTREQVEQALKSMRVDENTKEALTEIVYRRRSTAAVAKRRGLNRRILYVYATRLRRRLKKDIPTSQGLT